MQNNNTKPMKVLYVAHYKEKSGWARASIDNILALDSVGIDVVCRSIDLTNNFETPPELVHLERKECYDATHCVQHVLPQYFVGTNKYVKNIGYFVCETGAVKHLNWASHLHLVDELWVPNRGMRDFLVNYGYKCSVVRHCTDITKYAQSYPEIKIPKIDHTFKFYTIADFNDRKNLEAIIRCFHSEFDRSEPVSLILKLNKFNTTDEKLKQEAYHLCNNVKMRSRLYAHPSMYHEEVIITGRSSEEQVMALHQYGDCFLNFSHGEAWSIPTFDAMCFGKTPIATDLDGTREYMPKPEGNMTPLGVLIKSSQGRCNSVHSALKDLFTSRDYWSNIDEQEACEAMRYYYENRENRLTIGIKKAQHFSYKTVGQYMKELLND